MILCFFGLLVQFIRQQFTEHFQFAPSEPTVAHHIKVRRLVVDSMSFSCQLLIGRMVVLSAAPRQPHLTVLQVGEHDADFGGIQLQCKTVAAAKKHHIDRLFGSRVDWT